MIKLNGYLVSEKINENRHSVIYRAKREGDNTKVVIKVLNSEYPTLKEIEKIKREFEVIKQLSLPGVIAVYGIEQYRNTPALIFEDYGGVSLKNYTETVDMGVEVFLNIALQLTKALGEVHKKNVIHKDVNPSNILINEDTHEVKLADFGISTLLEKENQAAIHITELEGTLAYMSPEQTGRMNRAIDYRSDFYSLGITFYEMLCGTLPFVSEDPMELVHGHIARQPLSPREIIL